jgi:hypothetical protein
MTMSMMSEDLSHRMGPMVIRYHFLPFCNLDTLLRLNHVCRGFRHVLNDPAVMDDWQATCWWTQSRHCQCERRTYLLDVDRWCPFVWDYRGTGDRHDNLEGCQSVRDMQVVLRRYGRSIPMMLQSIQRPLRVPSVPYPRNHCACLFDVAQTNDCGNGAVFCPGMHSETVDRLLIPLPRMLSIPVERCRLGRAGDQPEPSAYWGRFHEVTDAMIEENERIKWDKQEVPPVVKDRTPAIATEFADVDEPYVDQVVRYMEMCDRDGRNPYDPCEDTADMDGYRAEQWARRLLYESPVGIQTFPLYLCIHRDDLMGTSHRMGPVYIDRHFLSSNAYEGGGGGELAVLGMHGEVLFNNVRYDNQRGDFTTWCLSTMGLLNATYHHLWHDYVRNFLRSLRLYLVGLVEEIQADLPMSHLVPQWQRLMRHLFVYQSFTANIYYPRPNEFPREKPYPLTDREKEALRFLMDGAHRTEFIHIQQAVEAWLHQPLTQQRLFREPYMRHLLPHEHWNSATYSEHALAQDVERLLGISEFLVGFSEKLGPRLDRNTVFLRRRMHRLYLNSGTSILLWAPHWQRPFPDGWRHIHTDPTEEVPLRLLNLNLHYNHRYVEYLRFLNSRALFHHATPDSWYTTQAHDQDVGRTVRA